MVSTPYKWLSPGRAADVWIKNLGTTKVRAEANDDICTALLDEHMSLYGTRSTESFLSWDKISKCRIYLSHNTSYTYYTCLTFIM